MIVILVALGVADDSQVLEMRIGLALRHGSPTALAKQLAGEVSYACGSDFGADDLQLVESLIVVLLDRPGAQGQIVERVAVSRQSEGHTLELTHPDE